MGEGGGERGILKPNLCKFKCPWGSHQNVEASYFISQWPNIEQWSFNCKIFGSQVSCPGSVWKRYTSSFRGKGNLIVTCIKVWNNDKLVIHGTEGWHRHQDCDHYGRNWEGHKMFYEKSMITEQKFCLLFSISWFILPSSECFWVTIGGMLWAENTPSIAFSWISAHVLFKFFWLKGGVLIGRKALNWGGLLRNF